MTADLNSISLFGIRVGESSWSGRVYAWTESRTQEAGRTDPKYVTRDRHIEASHSLANQKTDGLASCSLH